MGTARIGAHKMLAAAEECIARCRALALHTEEPGFTTRTFLAPSMRAVHRDLGAWMHDAGMTVSVDAVGNLRGHYAGISEAAPVLWIGSHLDTVPHAGAFDGILGVVMGGKLVELLAGRRLPYAIEVVGFSEEEGVRFGFPFIGSRGLIGDLDPALLSHQDSGGVSVLEAIGQYGLPKSQDTWGPSVGYLEFHIEQGPVLESLGLSLGVVTAIAGQTRLQLTFEGRAGHAGTTPMNLRNDALACAAEWIGEVEAHACKTSGLVATVGKMEVLPGAPNVIPSLVKLTLDVRHETDATRQNAVVHCLNRAREIAEKRGVCVTSRVMLDQAAVPMSEQFIARLSDAVMNVGHSPQLFTSGAGHDAMVMARVMPAAMLFLRSPGGISHHPDESVLASDVAAALLVGLNFLENLP